MVTEEALSPEQNSHIQPSQAPRDNQKDSELKYGNLVLAGKILTFLGDLIIVVGLLLSLFLIGDGDFLLGVVYLLGAIVLGGILLTLSQMIPLLIELRTLGLDVKELEEKRLAMEQTVSERRELNEGK